MTSFFKENTFTKEDHTFKLPILVKINHKAYYNIPSNVILVDIGVKIIINKVIKIAFFKLSDNDLNGGYKLDEFLEEFKEHFNDEEIWVVSLTDTYSKRLGYDKGTFIINKDSVSAHGISIHKSMFNLELFCEQMIKIKEITTQLISEFKDDKSQNTHKYEFTLNLTTEVLQKILDDSEKNSNEGGFEGEGKVYTDVFCCPKCYEKITKEGKLIKKRVNDSCCDCFEISEGLYEPTKCDVCRSDETSGCPGHLYKIDYHD